MSGYLWGKWPHRRITHTFSATSPLRGYTIGPPYVDTEGEFFLPRASPPEVFDTLMRVAGHKILVTGYLNLHNRSFPYPNLLRDFPLIPGKGNSLSCLLGNVNLMSLEHPQIVALLCNCSVSFCFISSPMLISISI